MHPSVETRVLSSQARQKSGAKERLFKVGDQVYVRNFASGAKWLPGVITTVRGSQVVTWSDHYCSRKPIL